MKKHARIFVAGHKGLVGSALLRLLQSEGYEQLLTRSSQELDLMDYKATSSFFEVARPEYVFLAAAKVGGILSNMRYPADFLYRNLQIQNNVIHLAYVHGVKKLLFLGSSCIYPRDCPQPMREEYLLSSAFESTNEAYALAKVAGLKMCQAYNVQYGTQFIACMPCNLYGQGDNFHPEHSHVLAALIRRFYEAQLHGERTVTLWGDGTPRREHLHVDDMARACLVLMNEFHPSHEDSKCGNMYCNVGSGEDKSILELAETVKKLSGFRGEICFDSSKPSGVKQKLLDISKIQQFHWRPQISLEQGIQLTYQWVHQNYIPQQKGQ